MQSEWWIAILAFSLSAHHWLALNCASLAPSTSSQFGFRKADGRTRGGAAGVEQSSPERFTKE
ncbi:hypothetical protein [Pseudanabaena sp. UWO311]|uniref:hypothetical protein n=1 Tax=Pseudanabaena sp. UWO311 TaxID=2487337 RepID=UPI0030D6D5EE